MTLSMHMCRVHLLLTHALRNGLVFGTTLQEVLDHTVGSPNRKLVWKFPKLPVLTAIARKPHRCNLEEATRPHQPLNAIKEMGLISNVVSRVYMHATRLGAARDIAHLPKSNEGGGITTHDVRQALGHTMEAFRGGTTERYVGDPSIEFYNQRAKNKHHENGLEPKHSEVSAYELVKAPVISQDILDWQRNNESSGGQQAHHPLNHAEKTTIMNRIRRQRLQTYIETAPFEESMTRDTVSVLRAKSASELKSSPQMKDHQVGFSEASMKGRCEASIKDRSEVTVESHSEVSMKGTKLSSSSQIMPHDIASIDPTLLDEATLSEAQVDEAALQCLRDKIFMQEAPAKEDCEQHDGATQSVNEITSSLGELTLLQENMQPTSGPGSSKPIQTGEDWISFYSKINVVHSYQFIAHWTRYSEKGEPFEDTIGAHSMRGNSRDDPTPYLFHCQKTEGCQYTSFKRMLLQQHESSCSQAMLDGIKEAAATAKDRIPCSVPGCGKSYNNKSHLALHMKQVHEWIPKPCDHGCDPAKIYQTGYAYDDHKAQAHSERWPALCTVEGCEETKKFASARTLKYHLEHRHGIKDPEEQTEYLPDRPARRKFIKEKCFIPNCSSQGIISGRCQLRKHLISRHHMDATEANAMIDARAYENVVPKIQVHRAARQVRPTKTDTNRQAIASKRKRED